MPVRERVKDFVDCVVSGDHVKAIVDFYHPDASMQENLSAPRVGRDQLVTHEERALARLSLMHTHVPQRVLVDGDHVVICWTFDATGKDGVTRRLEEVAVQTWRGDRIASEQFFYDTASAWREVTTDV